MVNISNDKNEILNSINNISLLKTKVSKKINHFGEGKSDKIFYELLEYKFFFAGSFNHLYLSSLTLL